VWRRFTVETIFMSHLFSREFLSCGVVRIQLRILFRFIYKHYQECPSQQSVNGGIHSSFKSPWIVLLSRMVIEIPHVSEI
jgi:hypothetical protein